MQFTSETAIELHVAEGLKVVYRKPKFTSPAWLVIYRLDTHQSSWSKSYGCWKPYGVPMLAYLIDRQLCKLIWWQCKFILDQSPIDRVLSGL